MPAPPKLPIARPLMVTPEASTVSPLVVLPAAVPSRVTSGAVPLLVASIVTGAQVEGDRVRAAGRQVAQRGAEGDGA
jgi:hypothetical protein